MRISDWSSDVCSSDLGNGAKPTQASEVSINYKGTLASGGQTFVDTFSPPEGQKAGPVSMKLSQIPLVGLREALAQMPSGSRWEVVLPPEKAYGNTPQSPIGPNQAVRSEAHTSELQSLMRISYAVFCLKKKK